MFHPFVQTLLIIDIILIFVLMYSLYKSYILYFSWDSEATTKKQYENEKTGFLLTSIIKYLIFFKIPLFLFFIFTLDKLALNFIGAMCAAGVVDNLDFGSGLLVFKIFNLFLLGFWLIIHKKDMLIETLPYSKTKYGLFLLVGILVVIELAIEIYTLSSIRINESVQCCGTIFSNTSTSYIGFLFFIDTIWYGVMFYSIFLILFMSYFMKNKFLFSFANIVYLIISLVSLILFFGTYIYELPTHHCPFCFLQKEYFYVGYFLYLSLFFGTFLGITTLINNNATISLILNSIFCITVSYYFISYYIKNGVLL
jgi:hypothetical protein